MIFDTQSATAASGTGQAAADKRKLDADLNQFLTLLVSQLQNQDPLEPLDANQFTSQLVQFASVEQQIYQNANLEKLLSAQQNAQLASTVGYLGKQVEASGDALQLQGGEAFASYTLPQTASRATIMIMDATGKTVAALPANTAAGRHELHWDGRATDGTQLPDGAYSFKLDAKDRSGDAIAATLTYSGRVTALTSDQTGTQLSLGDEIVSMQDLLSITDARATDPSLTKTALTAAAKTALDAATTN
jgi:flagellar basal-body rod modification protein FlgD